MTGGMTQAVDPIQSPNEVVKSGGVRRIAVSLISLCGFLLACVMPFAATYELWLVGQVATWPEVPVRLDAVARKRPPFGKGPPVWRFQLFDAQRGQTYETGDIAPGDFPLMVMDWSTIDRTAQAYQLRVGETIRVRRAPDGERYFLRRGDASTMTVALLLSATYWLWLILRWHRQRRSL